MPKLTPKQELSASLFLYRRFPTKYNRLQAASRAVRPKPVVPCGTYYRTQTVPFSAPDGHSAEKNTERTSLAIAVLCGVKIGPIGIKVGPFDSDDSSGMRVANDRSP